MNNNLNMLFKKYINESYKEYKDEYENIRGIDCDSYYKGLIHGQFRLLENIKEFMEK